MFRLDNKTAFITGAGSGIGEETARLFARQGARVVVADVNLEAAEKVVGEIGEAAAARRVDVTNSDEVREAMQWAAREFGGLHVLVNNAGIGLVGNVEETSEEDFERLMRVNVTGVFLGCKHAVPLMLEQGGGNIINIGSVAGLVAIERRFAYSATKGAVVALSRQLAMDYVAKGIVEAYLNKFHAGEIEETKSKLNARQPMGRMGRPDEIAKMAVYLAADESEFVTGAVYPVDGGLTAR
jgi:NAD(P)-dependent dehydrogenase (short-subunit alcohol dehydrogenase family)